MTPEQTFVEEARELLGQLEGGLESGQSDGETVNALFRAAHTLKGAAGIFGFEGIVRFAHAAENLMETIRAGARSLDTEARGLLLEAHDELARLVERVAAGQAPGEGKASVVDGLLALTGGGAGAGAVRAAATPPPLARRRWRVRVAFGPTVFTDGFDPVAFFRYLEKLGPLSARRTELERIPTGPEFDPERCYLAVAAELETAAGQREIEQVFEFVREGSQLEVVPLVEEAVAAPAPPAAEAPREAAPARAERPTVRVPAERLDLLVDLVGELVIAGASSALQSRRGADAASANALQALTGLIASIRDAALSLRMVPIGEALGRFRRVVRDLGAQLGKEVRLELVGAETELDKALVERLVEPLTHLVRNSLDHGLEAPAQRVAAGKPAQGCLTIAARQEGGSMVIEVRDDGRGLDRARILAKAVEKGLVPASATLRPEEIAELIFLPGFSSAEAVSELSGRGVGMDVVKRTVEELKGTIELASEPGKGTTTRLRLPLTLAIIDGFLVSSAETTCVLPVKAVVECLDLAEVLESELHHRLQVRESPLPFVRLRELFGVGGKGARENVVVVEHGEQRVGLVVDRLLGATQTVIKPLGPLFQQVQGLAGATVLGNGEVGFILDVGQVLRLATRPRGGVRA